MKNQPLNSISLSTEAKKLAELKKQFLTLQTKKTQALSIYLDIAYVKNKKQPEQQKIIGILKQEIEIILNAGKVYDKVIKKLWHK
jgi:hypothetical protein